LVVGLNLYPIAFVLYFQYYKLTLFTFSR